MKVQDGGALLQIPREKKLMLHTLEPSAGGFFSETWKPDRKWEDTLQLLKETRLLTKNFISTKHCFRNVKVNWDKIIASKSACHARLRDYLDLLQSLMGNSNPVEEIKSI